MLDIIKKHKELCLQEIVKLGASQEVIDVVNDRFVLMEETFDLDAYPIATRVLANELINSTEWDKVDEREGWKDVFLDGLRDDINAIL